MIILPMSRDSTPPQPAIVRLDKNESMNWPVAQPRIPNRTEFITHQSIRSLDVALQVSDHVLGLGYRPVGMETPLCN